MKLTVCSARLKAPTRTGFKRDDFAAYRTIMGYITGALNDLNSDPPRVVEGREKFSLGCHEFNRYTNSKNGWWRFTYCYGRPPLISLFGVLTLLLSIWFFFHSALLDLTVLWVPSWALLWGAVGGSCTGYGAFGST
jgi:hypothetical protein